MSLPEFPLEGGCRCDAVRFRVAEPPLLECACHCRGCQRMASSAFSLTGIWNASAFEVIQGSPVVGGVRGPELQHFFCESCMTWLFTRPTTFPQIVNVRPTMLQEYAWFAPFMETGTGTRLPWAETGAVRSFEDFPPMDTFEELLREYRAWREAS